LLRFLIDSRVRDFMHVSSQPFVRSCVLDESIVGFTRQVTVCPHLSPVRCSGFRESNERAKNALDVWLPKRVFNPIQQYFPPRGPRAK